MSRFYYCTECGTIKPPHYKAENEKPCCQDNYAIPCDLTIAEQARFGFRCDVLLNAIAPSRESYLYAYAIIRDWPPSKIVEELEKFKAIYGK